MKRTAAALGAVVVILGIVAFAVPALAAPKLDIKVTLSPTKPKNGQAVAVTGTGGPKNSPYNCVEALMHKGYTPGGAQAYLPTLRNPVANSKGKVVCHSKFGAFSAKARGATRHCPPTKADKKAGWGCGFILATADNKQAGKARFKF
jgi:hypothetical protein